MNESNDCCPKNLPLPSKVMFPVSKTVLNVWEKYTCLWYLFPLGSSIAHIFHRWSKCYTEMTGVFLDQRSDTIMHSLNTAWRVKVDGKYVQKEVSTSFFVNIFAICWKWQTHWFKIAHWLLWLTDKSVV